MKLTHYLGMGLLSFTLLSGASVVSAKPEFHRDIEKHLPHKRVEKHIKKHINKINDKGRRFYNDDHRPHPDERYSKHERHHNKHKHKHRKHKHWKHHKRHGGHRHGDYYHDHHYGDRYYNGWNRHKRHHKHYGHRYHHNDYRPHHSAGYWRDHHRHGYRHKRYKGHHYYYDRAGFYFPGFGLIKHGHRHGRHCPDWHLEPFVAGIALGAILNH